MPRDPEWKTNPGIQAAKQAMKKIGGQMVILISLNVEAGQIKGFSYGVDRELCDMAGKILKESQKTVLATYTELIKHGS